jgi:hypothetical protein
MDNAELLASARNPLDTLDLSPTGYALHANSQDLVPAQLVCRWCRAADCCPPGCFGDMMIALEAARMVAVIALAVHQDNGAQTDLASLHQEPAVACHSSAYITR